MDEYHRWVIPSATIIIHICEVAKIMYYNYNIIYIRYTQVAKINNNSQSSILIIYETPKNRISNQQNSSPEKFIHSFLLSTVLTY